MMRKCEYCNAELMLTTMKCKVCSYLNYESRSHKGVYKKGREAFKNGLTKKDCPYIDWRTDYREGVTFSRSYINAWEYGWEFEKQRSISTIPIIT